MHTLWCFTWRHHYMWICVTVPVCNNHHRKLAKKPIFLQFPLQMYLFVCCSGHSPVLLAGFKCSSAVLTITPRSTWGQKMCKFRHHGHRLPGLFSGPPDTRVLLCIYELYITPWHMFLCVTLLFLVYCPLGTIQTPCFFVQTASTCDFWFL